MPEKHRQSLSDAARRMQGATHHLIYKEYCLYPKFGHKIPLIINTSRITDAGNTTHHLGACPTSCSTTHHLEPQLSSSLQLSIMPEKHRQSKADGMQGTTHHHATLQPSGNIHHLGRYLSTSSSNNTFAASNSIPFLLLTFCPL